MRVLEVIPISKGITKETLSYFSANDFPIGSIIKVSLRKKIVPALVISSKNAHEAKAEIKESPFALKKIENAKTADFLRKEFVDTCFSVSEYFVSSAGSVINALVPKVFFEKSGRIKIGEEKNKYKSATKAEKFVIQSSDEDRLAHYKSIIREEFAKGFSVFFCLPTIQDIKKTVETLQKGIEPYTFAFHSGLSKVEILKQMNKVLAETHPILIIGTAQFLSIPKKNISTIIVDRENSRSYKSQTRPYVDTRFFAEKFSEKLNAKIIFGDMLLRAETIFRFRENELFEVAPLKFRSLGTLSEKIIDMRLNDKPSDESKKVFQLFSPDLKELIKDTVENNGHLFLFVSRRGFSPSTVCGDCGNIVKCNTCGAHTVLHLPKDSSKNQSENFFLCHKCGERRKADEKCTNCGSWKLTTLGIGSELIEEIIKEKFPNQNVLRIDADKTPTHKRALEVAEKFYSLPSAILIGTEMALLYLAEKVENSAVVSMDAFFSVPDYRINERVMNIILKMRAITTRKLLIQTRDMNQPVFEYAMRGNLIDFFKDEIDDRKKLEFPPFSTILKITVSGTKNELLKFGEELQKIAEPYEISLFPAFVPLGKNRYSIHGIIKVKDWPDKNFINKLKALPPNFSINVDPESLI